MVKLAYAALPIAFGALLLAGCGQTAGPANASRTARTEAPANDAAVRSGARDAAPAPGGPSSGIAEGDTRPPQGPGPDLTAPTAPILAFDYRYGLALPSRNVRPVMEAHQEACERAGPTQCQVVGVDVHDSDEDRASAELTLRATPAWMRLFRDRLAGDARDAGGRVLAGNTTGQDVAPVIQAASDQEQQLRDRRAELMGQIARADGKTLTGLREELAQLEGQISEVRAQRESTEGRAAMATMVIDYQANGLIAATGDGAPLAESLRHFWRNTAQVAAVLVDIGSVMAPFVILGAPIWWLIARARRRPIASPPPASPGTQTSGS